MSVDVFCAVIYFFVEAEYNRDEQDIESVTCLKSCANVEQAAKKARTNNYMKAEEEEERITALFIFWLTSTPAFG